MKQLFFWKSWSLSERRTVPPVLILLLVCLLYLVVFSGILTGGRHLEWDMVSQLTDIFIPANQLNLGSFDFTVPVPSAYVTEQYVAPLALPDQNTGIVFLLFSVFGLSLVLASLTTLSRFWYLGGTAVFILLLVFSRTEVIILEGLPERTLLVVALVLYVGTGYYFHAFKPHTGIVTRVLTFVAISCAVMVLVYFFSSVPNPFYTFLAYSLPLWMVPAVIFFLVSATEIIYGLVWLTTSKATGMGSRSLPNFLIMGFIYLLILVFAYVGNTRMADWGMVLLPVYLLGGAAALIGFYSFRLRCEGTEGHISFRESGFWLYAGLFAIATGVIGAAVAADNDPLLEVLEDSVVNAQLGMGAAFLFYIAANFLPLFRQGLQVHKVLYKPLSFSLTKVRVIGFGIVAVLFSMQNLFPVKQAIAGYFNNLGDLYTLTEEYVLAEQYFQKSLQYEFQNHKANYALASLARMQGDHNAAVFYFRQATLKKPSPQSYIGLSNLLAGDNLYFEAMFSLKEGAKVFPDNGPILNNLGLMYAQTNVSDSAYYFLNAAANGKGGEAASANILGTLARVLDGPALEALASESSGASLSFEANRLLARNLAGINEKIDLRKDATRQDSLLSATGYAYWLNYVYNQKYNDSTVSQQLRNLIPRNGMVADELLFAAAHADFYSGDKTKALEAMMSLAAGEGKKSALYHCVLGHWFLQLGLYEKAIEEFAPIDEKEAIIGQAVAQTLAQNPVAGVILLDKLTRFGIDAVEITAVKDVIHDVKSDFGKREAVLTMARKAGREEAFRKALKFNPYDPVIVTEAVDFFTKQKVGSQVAYQIVVDALRFNESSYQLWADYALLNLDLGLSEQAEEGRSKVRELTGDTDYHDFYTRYQAKWSLKQKERDAFR